MLTKSWEVLEEQAPAGPPGAAIKRTTHTGPAKEQRLQHNREVGPLLALGSCYLSCESGVRVPPP